MTRKELFEWIEILMTDGNSKLFEIQKEFGQLKEGNRRKKYKLQKYKEFMRKLDFLFNIPEMPGDKSGKYNNNEAVILYKKISEQVILN